MTVFDLFTISLNGTHLIEASAGTGKTYSLEGLYVRILLEKELSPDQILVVTFTRAATEELRSRIRQKLVLLNQALVLSASDDAFIRPLLDRIENKQRAKNLVQTALIDFDKAAIHTIHGFCQRILSEYAFETGSLLDLEVSPDSSVLFKEIVDDFWRIYFYDAPSEVISHALEKKITGPEYFFALLKRSRQLSSNVIPHLNEPSLDSLDGYRAIFETLKGAWSVSKADIIERLKDPVLNGKQYGTLKPLPASPGLSRRDIRVAEMVVAMDYFTARGSAGHPLCKQFESFRQSVINASTKKNQEPPQHDFFLLCDDVFEQNRTLKIEIDRYLLYLKSEFLNLAGVALSEKKKETNLISYDDLLIMVKEALDGKGCARLAVGIRNQYQAVLVDEFQDTDSIQYDIFSKLFHQANQPLFLIGDPKQSIYGFRGADIFSYLNAVKQVDTPITLSHNFRSDPSLIAAVNAVFLNRQHSFLFKDISFEKAVPGISDVPLKCSAPMVLWHLFQGDDKPVSRARATDLTTTALVAEIIRLNHEEGYELGDIAVLVRTNRQAKTVQEYLGTKKVPSVIYQSGNVFNSHEALELQRVMLGIVTGNTGFIEAALATDLLGGKGRSDDDNETLSGWEITLSRFKRYGTVWKEQGFIRMFRQLMADERIKARLMQFHDGERRLTNVLHLSEILHQTAAIENLSRMELVKWLNEKRQSEDTEDDAHLLRLESDVNAVNILTIHKSKGLEFPVVFCPFAWEASTLRGEGVEFHDPSNHHQRTFDLGSENIETNTLYAENEQLAENLRLLYVALTRARSKCYLAWGRIRNAETSAPAYLFHYDGDIHDNLLSVLKNSVALKSDKELLIDLEKLAALSHHTISLERLPVKSEIAFPSKEMMSDRLTCKKFTGSVFKEFRITSYSALTTPGSRLDGADRDLDAVNAKSTREPHPEEEVTHSVVGNDDSDICNFPKGTRAGLFFHDVFEHLDFMNDDDLNVETLIREKLRQYGFDLFWTKAVRKMVSRVISTNLMPDKNFSLSMVSTGMRLNETAFYYPIDRLTPKMLSDMFCKFASGYVPENYYQQVEALHFLPLTGFLKGFIDLIIFHDGCYYLLDWKSNHLGPADIYYDRPAIQNAMAEHHYVMQYHLYVTALHRYLGLRQPGYRYNVHFGGVFYLFIRGMDPDKGNEYGIYFDRPKKEMIESLETVLMQP